MYQLYVHYGQNVTFHDCKTPNRASNTKSPAINRSFCLRENCFTWYSAFKASEWVPTLSQNLNTSGPLPRKNFALLAELLRCSDKRRSTSRVIPQYKVPVRVEIRYNHHTFSGASSISTSEICWLGTSIDIVYSLD